MNDEQARVAKAYIAQLNSAHVFQAPIVTTIEPGKTFYRAEDYHQDFLAKNPGYPYIVYNDLPKIANLKRLFPSRCSPPGSGGSASAPADGVWADPNPPRPIGPILPESLLSS